MPAADAVPAVAFGLVAAGFGLSGLVWTELGRRWLAGQPVVPIVEPTSRPRPAWAVLGALGWTVFVLLNRIAADLATDRIPPDVSQVWMNLGVSAGVLVLLAGLLWGDGQFTPRAAGLVPSRLTIPYGIGAFLASIGPTIMALMILLPFRTRETQHQLLQLLGDSPDEVTLMALAVTVVLAAPLAEELLFRVTLQGWLTAQTGRTVAVPMVAALFAAVHGWRDGLALIPLALILGELYHRRQDYWVVALTHALFNGANLGLALLTLPRPPAGAPSP